MNYETAITNVLLLCMLTTPHEFAHAWAAARLGDDTPERDGRLTLNPLKHIDWLGTVLLPAITSLGGGGFLGWGKPVVTNPDRLRGGLRGLALVALAGPASNVILAGLLAAVTRLAAIPAPALAGFAAQGVYLSLYLAAFNLLPVPPLDGSKLLLISGAPLALYRMMAQWGFVILIVALTSTPLGRWLSVLSWEGTRALLNFLQ